jgi:hypothetical protein
MKPTADHTRGPEEKLLLALRGIAGLFLMLHTELPI